MRFKSYKLTLDEVQHTTYRQKERVTRTLELAERYRTDPDRKARLADVQCVVCFYGEGRIGGAAITESSCGACGVGMTFGSTCVDRLCPACARTLKVCRQCGSDLNHVMRRRLDIDSIAEDAEAAECRGDDTM